MTHIIQRPLEPRQEAFAFPSSLLVYPGFFLFYSLAISDIGQYATDLEPKTILSEPERGMMKEGRKKRRKGRNMDMTGGRNMAAD